VEADEGVGRGPGGPPHGFGLCETLQYPVNPWGTLLASAVQVIIETKAIEVPYRPPAAEEEESA